MKKLLSHPTTPKNVSILKQQCKPFTKTSLKLGARVETRLAGRLTNCIHQNLYKITPFLGSLKTKRMETVESVTDVGNHHLRKHAIINVSVRSEQDPCVPSLFSLLIRDIAHVHWSGNLLLANVHVYVGFSHIPLSLGFPSLFIVFRWTPARSSKESPNMVGIHSTVKNQPKRILDPTVETTSVLVEYVV